ncbi:proteasome subunit domain-containing protein [Ditylenchus destructor]|nr:proteasome subunit domain-containing protein [Ditylenchus destructor]
MDPVQNTLNPTCTGTSVIALTYDGGVAMGTDRVVSYGKMARYKGVSRQYRVNDNCIVSFGGDHADFQWLQNVIERRQEELLNCDRTLQLTPKMVHAYLTTFMYFRRTKMNPLWNTLIVSGMQPDSDNSEMKVPFIGVVTQRGVAYETKSVATGLGAMLLHQFVETNHRAKAGKLTRNEALDLLRRCMELSIYHDCVADQEFDISYVETAGGAALLKPEKIIGNWDIAEYNCQYQ